MKKGLMHKLSAYPIDKHIAAVSNSRNIQCSSGKIPVKNMPIENEAKVLQTMHRTMIVKSRKKHLCVSTQPIYSQHIFTNF